MTLHVYDDIEQGTPEWHDVRRGIVTASTVGQLITAKTMKPAANDYSRALTAQLVAERITGFTDDTYVNFDMQRGWNDEPIARDLYAKHFAPVTEVGFMVLDHVNGRIGCSPDGLVRSDGMIEIKSRRPKKHLQTVLAGEVPGENMAQIQAALFVSGRDWCDYVSFCGGMALWVKRVEPDEGWFGAIADTLAAFEETAAQMIRDYQIAVEDMPMTERIEYGLELKL